MNERDGTHPPAKIPTDQALKNQAQLLSSRVEAELNKPAIVMITSACGGDGKSLTAYMLAASLENSYRVSLIEIPNEEETSSEPLSAFVERMRANYDYTIIDAAPFLKSGTVLSLARLVDGILVAVRIGRAPTADDETMVGILEQFGGNVLGVVATEADAIATFESTHRESRGLTRLQPRRNPKQNPAQALMAVVSERMLR